MARTQKSLDDNLSKLTTTKKRKTRKDKKPVWIDTKSDTKFTSANSFPWCLHPKKANRFNRSWFRDYYDACKQIERLIITPDEYTLWHLNIK